MNLDPAICKQKDRNKKYFIQKAKQLTNQA